MRSRRAMLAPTDQAPVGGARGFGLRFAAIAAVLLGLYVFPYDDDGRVARWFATYLEAYARLTGALLGLVEPNVRVEGTDILGRTVLRIVKSCDAMDANILFSAAVLAYPGGWRRRVLGLALGLGALVTANLLRIVSLYFISLSAPSWFEFFHIELWPLLMVVTAVVLFYLCSRWMAIRPRAGAAA